MKAGTESRAKVVTMLALMVIAVFMAARTFFTSAASSAVNSPSSTVTAKATQGKKNVAPRRSNTRSWRTKDDTVSSLDPTLRFDWLKNSEDRAYTGGKRNIFDMAPEPPSAPKVESRGPRCPGDPGCPPPPPVCPGPDPRCPPPPINIKFYGFANKPGEPRRVFLSSGDDVFIAAEGDIVNRRYRVVRISGSSVEIEDVLNNNKQTIPLT
jgi:hypothetical protein